jgi:hypothetical protein
MNTHSLLFVPDITGFTEFVNKTEIEHSQHIISELLESIIDGNVLGMEVSEVEGDAVLFYKQEHVPDAEAVFAQVKKMFLDFHAHLRLYDKQRICQCGACSTASRLSLKFVVHSGQIGFTNIKNQKKPFGADVVLLHKLLKNDVQDGEYVLFSEQYINDVSVASLEKLNLKLHKCQQEYEAVGIVNYQYLKLGELHREVIDPPTYNVPAKSKNPISAEQVFDLPLMESYEYLSNFELKKTWNAEVTDFKYEKGKLNRMGTRHICVFEKGTAEFESVKNDFGEGNLVYGEKLLNFPLAKDFVVYFILTPIQDRTKIRIETHYKPLPVIGWIFKPIINLNIKKINRKFIKSFSKLKREESTAKSVPVLG